MRSRSLFSIFTKAASRPGVSGQLPPSATPAPQQQPQPSTTVDTPETPETPEVKPLTFKGGYTVRPSGNKVDWSAKGDGHINIRGTKFTDEQYAEYNNVRSSLATAIRQQEGVSTDEARRRANLLADQWAADQTQVAAGGTALERWKHVERPATNPVTAGLPAAEAPSPTTMPAAQPTPSPTPADRPFSEFDNKPITLSTIPGLNITGNAGATQPAAAQQTTPQPAPQPAPEQPAQPAQPAAATPSTTTPASSGTSEDPVESPAWDFRARALENRNKVADGLSPVNGYQGIYYKPGDASGTLYKNNGEPWRNSAGRPVDAGMLRADTNWFGASGNDIKHNIEQRYQEDANRAFTPEEAAALGFKPIPGAPGYYANSKGEIVDEFGNAEEEGTLMSDVGPSIWNDLGKAWREWAPDPAGLFWSGSRNDYK